MISVGKIFILSGEIQTGKTTHLMQWVRNRNDVQGILTPIINGKRYFMNIQSKEIFLMEAEADEKDTIAVGKYIFGRAAFDRANHIIASAITLNSGWLIIDEIGPLELKEKGFYLTLNTILKQYLNMNILLVIRLPLLNQVISKFDIENFSEFQKTIKPRSDFEQGLI